MLSYLQEKKCKARHLALKNAITKLTTERTSCCCVDNMYVRDLYDYFCDESDGTIKKEVLEIDKDYIKEWEKFQKSYIGAKSVEDLSICYLCGPEPENDFKELISLGILPHNIWAFESDEKTYNLALQQICEDTFPRPKLLGINIEKYFKDFPKKFDIFYYDSCSTAISKSALRVVTTMCKYHRLNSPGIIITNFSEPDLSHKFECDKLKSILDPYYSCKKNKRALMEKEVLRFDNAIEFTEETIHRYYSDFITDIITDSFSSIIPLQRFMNSEYAQEILDFNLLSEQKYSFEEFNDINNKSIYKLYYLRNLLQQENILQETYKNIIGCLSGYEGYKYDAFSCCFYKEMMKDRNNVKKEGLKSTIGYFNDPKNLFRFLDRPDSTLYIDLLINQMGYPLHCVTGKIERYEYVAKTNKMLLDIIPFDECRYIYEWLPSIDQVAEAFKNKSWQYIFRFAVDGLVKNRINNSNSGFYSGSVIAKSIDRFSGQEISERRKI